MALDVAKLRGHLSRWKKSLAEDPARSKEAQYERAERAQYYQSWTASRILEMSEDDLYAYIAKLWAMLIWGNKKYVVDKLIADNGFENLKTALADLIWGKRTVAERWDAFRATIKGIGPAMMSEILSHVHPDECAIWNRRAYAGLTENYVNG
ncbi:MAG: hypothetical protein ACREUO_04340 [Burkholderiales bacterium]